MVGRSSSARLRSLGITTIGELAHTDKDFFNAGIQKPWVAHVGICQRIAPAEVHSTVEKLKGVGNSTTLSQDVSNADDAKKCFACLSGTGLFEAPKVQSACTVRNRGDQIQHVSTYLAPEGARSFPRIRPSRSMSSPAVSLMSFGTTLRYSCSVSAPENF